ncbi:MAG: Ig domain protein group 2 domain protein [Gammaproteobacteria bacterium]|nr:Ig domain protein group 2 domain protein [Gammaproteobacteria bacterium]
MEKAQQLFYKRIFGKFLFILLGFFFATFFTEAQALLPYNAKPAKTEYSLISGGAVVVSYTITNNTGFNSYGVTIQQLSQQAQINKAEPGSCGGSGHIVLNNWQSCTLNLLVHDAVNPLYFRMVSDRNPQELYWGAEPVKVIVKSAKDEQLKSISLQPSTATIPIGASQVFSATGYYNDGSFKAITPTAWSSSNPSVASISSNSKALKLISNRKSVKSASNEAIAKALALGETSITASVGAITSSPAALTVKLPILESISVEPTSASIPNGTSQQYSATGHYQGGYTQDITSQVTWASKDTRVAIIDATGKATGKHMGSDSITANLGNIVSTPVSLNVTTPLVTSITISPAASVVPVGLTQALTATANYTDGSSQDVTKAAAWSSSDATIVSVNAAGVAKGLKIGSTNITASYSGKTSPAANMSVTKAVLQSIAITPVTQSIAKGLTQTYTAIGTYSDQTSVDISQQVTWTSSDTSVAQFKNNIATGMGQGGATISANLQGITSPTVKLTVTSAILQSIKITPATQSMPNGYTQQYTATGVYSDQTTQDLTKNVSWSSSDTTIATVDSNGFAKSLKEGEVSIKAALDDINASADLKITPAVLQSIAIIPATLSMPNGYTEQYKAIGTYSDRTTQEITSSVSWSSSDTTIASINTNGVATGLNTGEVTIKAALDSVNASADLKITPAVLLAISIAPSTQSMAAGYTQQYAATGTYSDKTSKDITSSVVWSSSDATVASIDSSGLAESFKEGEVSIKAALGSVNASADLKITPAVLQSISITPSAQNMPAGYTQQYAATGTYSDKTSKDITSSVIWSSSDTTVASIDNNGLAKSFKEGEISIKAALGSVNASADLKITPAALLSINVTPANASINSEQQLQYKAMGTYSDGHTGDVTSQATWSSSDSSIANIDAKSGLATGQDKGGQCAISASITVAGQAISGSTNLTVATILKSISVTPANASINSEQQLQYQAIGTYSDGHTIDLTSQVTWSSSDASVASIDAKSGLVTGQDKGGQCVISASITVAGQTISGGTNLTVATILKSINVTPANATINSESTLSYKAIGTYSDGHTNDLTSQVTWSSSDASVASIDAHSGIATGQDKGGQCAILASITVAGQKISGGTNLTVATILKSISVAPANTSINSEQQLQYQAIGTYSDGHTIDLTSQVTWSSSDSSIASIDAKSGLATGQDKGGQCAILASITVAGQTISGSTNLTVATILKSINVTPANASINSEQQVQYKAIGTYSDGRTIDLTSQVTWSSSDGSVASIDAKSGLATGQDKGGQCVILASITVAGQTISGSTNLTVATILKSISVAPANASINSEQQVQYKAIGTYSDGRTIDLTSQVTWSSSDSSVASIDAKSGLVTGQDKGGQCVILASITVAGQTISGSTNLTVATILKSISVAPANASINSEQQVQYKAVGTYSDGRTIDLTSQVTWSSSDSSVASIDAKSGLANGQDKGGQCAISASITIAGQTINGSTNLTVTAILKSITVSPANASINSEQQVQYKAVGTYSDGHTNDLTSQVTWSSSDSSVASIDAKSGLATGQDKGGQCVISASITVAGQKISGGTYLNVKVILTSITIAPQAAVLPKSYTSSDSKYASQYTQQYIATGHYSNGEPQDITSQVTWSLSDPSVASINATGLAMSVDIGTTNISASLDGVSSASPGGLTVKQFDSISLGYDQASCGNDQVINNYFQGHDPCQFTATGKIAESEKLYTIDPSSIAWNTELIAPPQGGVDLEFDRAIPGKISTVPSGNWSFVLYGYLAGDQQGPQGVYEWCNPDPNWGCGQGPLGVTLKKKLKQKTVTKPRVSVPKSAAKNVSEQAQAISLTAASAKSQAEQKQIVREEKLQEERRQEELRLLEEKRREFEEKKREE